VPLPTSGKKPYFFIPHTTAHLAFSRIDSTLHQ
jgi:hypothetical protein